MRYYELLNELFDKSAPWQLVQSTDEDFTATFKIDSHMYDMRGGVNIQGHWNIFFMMDGMTDMTGTGNEFQVFATVKEIFADFIKRISPQEFSFSADLSESSRVSLYDRMAKQIGSKFKYTVHHTTKYGELHFNFTKITNQIIDEASVTVDDRDIPVTLSVQSPKSLYQLVDVDVAKLDLAFSKEHDFYVGKGGLGGIRNRYERFTAFISTAESVEAAIIDIDERGNVCFVNGRHCFAYFRDQGIKSLPVAMSAESIKNATKYGLIY